MASSWGPNLPEVSYTRDKTVNPNLSRGKSKQHQPNTSLYHDACKPVINDEKSRKKPRNLLICSTCRMHNGK
jgi:hypothetical protein